MMWQDQSIKGHILFVMYICFEVIKKVIEIFFSKIKEYFEVFLYKNNKYDTLKRIIYDIIPYENNKFICIEYIWYKYISVSTFKIRDIEFICLNFIKYEKENKIKLLTNHVIYHYEYNNKSIKFYELVNSKNNNKYLLHLIGVIKEIEGKIEDILKIGNYFLCFKKNSLNIYILLKNKYFQLQVKFYYSSHLSNSYNFRKAFILTNKKVRIFLYETNADLSFITLKIKNCKVIEKSTTVRYKYQNYFDNIRMLNNNMIISFKYGDFTLFSINKQIITKIKEICFMNMDVGVNYFITKNSEIYGYNSKRIYKLDFKKKISYQILYDKNDKIFSVNPIENEQNSFLIQNEISLKILNISNYYILKHYIMFFIDSLPVIIALIIFVIIIWLISKINIIKTTTVMFMILVAILIFRQAIKNCLLRIFDFKLDILILFVGTYILIVLFRFGCPILSIIYNKIVNSFMLEFIIFVILLCLEIFLFAMVYTLYKKYL